MGHPKKFRKKYSTPSHPWQKERIDSEKLLSDEFGLKNKKEIWKINSLLSNFKRQAKKYSATDTDQSKKESEQLMARLRSYGFIKEGSTFDDVLGLDVRDLLKRRLQSVLVEKDLARSAKQARQMVTHNHVSVGGKTITAPSYLVKLAEEVAFHPSSSFVDETHPERVREKTVEETKEENKEAYEAEKASAEKKPTEEKAVEKEVVEAKQ